MVHLLFGKDSDSFIQTPRQYNRGILILLKFIKLILQHDEIKNLQDIYWENNFEYYLIS